MPSSTQGQSLIVVNRNVQEEVPQTYSEFSSYMGCVTNPIWTNVTCPGSGGFMLMINGCILIRSSCEWSGFIDV